MVNPLLLSFLINFFLINFFKIIFINIYQITYLNLFYLNNQAVNLIILSVLIGIHYQYINVSFSTILLGYYLKFLQSYSGHTLIIWVNALVVGLNNIHPYIYYLGFLSLILYCAKSYTIYSNYFLVSILQILLCALLLGMYWGCSASVWGFFWVDDYIELVLLGFCMLVLYNLHIYSTNNYINVVLMLISGVLLVILRNGIAVTRHSFFLNFNVMSYPLYISYIFGYFVLANYKLVILINYIYIVIVKYLLAALCGNALVSLEKFIKKKVNLVVHLVVLIGLVVWIMFISNYFSYSYCKFYMSYCITEYYNTKVCNSAEFIILHNLGVKTEEFIVYYSLVNTYLLTKFRKVVYLVLLYGTVFTMLLVILTSTKKIYDN